jgi:hypothetical protein
MNEEIDVLRLEPGDSLVLTAKERLSIKQMNEIRDKFAELYPGHRVIILTAGMELSIVRECEP